MQRRRDPILLTTTLLPQIRPQLIQQTTRLAPASCTTFAASCFAVPATSEPADTAVSFTSAASDFATSDFDPAPEPEVEDAVVAVGTYVGGLVTPDRPPDVADPPVVDPVVDPVAPS